MNEENIKKTRKPRLPRLDRKFANLQTLVEEIQNDVKVTLEQANAPKKLTPSDIDLSKLSNIELLQLQLEISRLLLTKKEGE